jgi:predicted regulator of Ras-like GTPase activity (Roadblock/LC7/MglB family)
VPDEVVRIMTIKRQLGPLWKAAVTPTHRRMEFTVSLENVLKKVQTTVPECLAAGVVDMETGMLLSIRTVDSHPSEVIDLLAAATGELFQGENVTAIENMFKRIRGVKEDGHHYFQEIVIFSDNLLHLFQRCKKNANVVLVTVCRKKANLGMVMVKARGTLEEVDRAI